MVTSICVALLLSPLSSAASLSQASPPAAFTRPDLAPALAAWRTAHGRTWRLSTDADTGWLEILSGGRAVASFRPRNDEEFVSAARTALAETSALHGLDLETLSPAGSLFLPLGQIGSTDKQSVRFRQVVRGVPVVGGFVNVLLSADGSLLSVHSTGLPALAAFPTSPALTERRALARALELFRIDFGLDPNRTQPPRLVIDQVRTDAGDRLPRLCWEVDAQWIEPGFEPAGRTYWIDAGDGRLVRSQRNIHDFDVSGTLSSMATPGLLPDTAANPETSQILKYVRVTSSAGETITDTNGNFVFPGVNTPLACTFTYTGTFNSVENGAGAEYSLTQTIPANVPTSVLMNPSSTATVTAQANVVIGVDKQRDFVRAINPADAALDFVHSGLVNMNSTCNAFFDGGQINFFAAGGGCVNTAYSTVIAHEDGHWANQVYNTGNGPDGMGEGNADVWAMYVWDTPIVGQNFAGAGNNIRTGNNTRQFCGDCCGGCYGEVHADGEPWMGAAWKIRTRLGNTNGGALGDLIANTLFLTWMEAYNQGQIRSVIETQWLTLDDTDGNIDNGTPHFTDIDLGFRDQGFPGVVMRPVSFGSVTALNDTEIQAAPQTVSAVVHANAAPPLTVAVLRYRVNGGAYQELNLTNVAGDQFEATIPGLLAPAHVQYYILATDSAAHTATYPTNAPDGLLDYDVGAVHVLFFNDFDDQSSAWTHGTYGDTSNLEDDWQAHGPTGKGGTSGGVVWSDPYGAYSGFQCWGNDLGQGGANNGAYSANVHTWFRSPVIDCTAASGTQLRFKRWLTVQGSASDQARVRVNGVPVFSNPTANLVDTGWASPSIDISSIADGQASVQIEFELKSNGSTNLGGWQVDNIEVLWVGVPQCPAPTNFCLHSANSAGPLGAVMSSSGTSIVPNNDFVLRTSGCPAHKSGLYFYGQGETFVPFGSGVRCVAAPIRRLPITQTDAGGNASFALDLNNLPTGGDIDAGQVYGFQFWYRDPGPGGIGFNVSDALSVTFCP